jgi:hypothetical protein
MSANKQAGALSGIAWCGARNLRPGQNLAAISLPTRPDTQTRLIGAP